MDAAQASLKQGPHPDPLDPGARPPSPQMRSRRWTEAASSPEMVAYRAGLMIDGKATIRESILDDLSSFYRVDRDECVRRCVHWEQWSVAEWQARPRDSREGLADFYNTVQSWSFDLLWYAYLQAEGWAYPAPVVIARRLPRPAQGVRCLDFGSGVGDTAQMLLTLGYDVTLADVSNTLLTFARYRLERRGQRPGYINLNETELGVGQYDLVIARDVLTQIPDLREAVTTLHRALRPGGLLFANFDTRPPSPENAWHLYSDDVPLRRTVQDVGFEQAERIDGFYFMYRRVDPSGPSHLIRRGCNAVLFGPPRRAYRWGKLVLRRLLERIRRS